MKASDAIKESRISKCLVQTSSGGDIVQLKAYGVFVQTRIVECGIASEWVDMNRAAIYPNEGWEKAV